MTAVTSENPVDIQARVITYTHNAMTDHFDDNTFVVFDATTLEVLAPPALAGQLRAIYHEQPGDNSSPWRAIGATIRFLIPASLLNEETLWFSGATQALEVLSSGSH